MIIQGIFKVQILTSLTILIYRCSRGVCRVFHSTSAMHGKSWLEKRALENRKRWHAYAKKKGIWPEK